MSSPRIFGGRKVATNNVDLGNKVVLNDEYLIQNDKSLQMEAVFVRTLQNAEDMARDIVDGARLEAQELIKLAHEKAAKIVADEADAVLAAGHDEGYQAGLEKGFSRITAELTDKLLMADMILQKAFEAERILIENHRHQIVDVIRTVLGAILPYEMQANPQQILGIIAKVASVIEGTGEARLRMHPETLRGLKNMSPESEAGFAQVSWLHFVGDLNIPHNDLILETAESSMLISPESQAEVMLQYLSRNLDYNDETPALEGEDEDIIAITHDLLETSTQRQRPAASQNAAVSDDDSDEPEAALPTVIAAPSQPTLPPMLQMEPKVILPKASATMAPEPEPEPIAPPNNQDLPNWGIELELGLEDGSIDPLSASAPIKRSPRPPADEDMTLHTTSAPDETAPGLQLWNPLDFSSMEVEIATDLNSSSQKDED